MAYTYVDKSHRPDETVTDEASPYRFLYTKIVRLAYIQSTGTLSDPVELIVGKGYNHYEVGETLGHPYALLGRAALELMKLTTA